MGLFNKKKKSQEEEFSSAYLSEEPVLEEEEDTDEELLEKVEKELDIESLDDDDDDSNEDDDDEQPDLDYNHAREKPIEPIIEKIIEKPKPIVVKEEVKEIKKEEPSMIDNINDILNGLKNEFSSILVNMEKDISDTNKVLGKVAERLSEIEAALFRIKTTI